MKKLMITMMAALVLSTSGAMAQAINPIMQKQLNKEYKQKIKQFKKEKWQIYASSHSLEVALLQHYDKLAKGGDNAFEIVGIASKFKSKNVGHQTAINNACNTYARQAGSYIKGRIVSDLATSDSTERDHFYAAYQTLVEKEIKGEMQESFSMIHDLGDGTFEMQTFFVVNEEAARKARMTALENAAKESADAQKYAEQVSGFVKEGFKPEN